ncbi:(2Fe-2S)-binding protein [Marinagarivorans algicola]|uniref:(2Fe-2S)-binding protein n=1 Tax=Marinagarivorans algicola TaxID=1513270 RepID=UPI0006B49108|nr:(2Fe-2S)-binding protein [Marinagarivorans algicola]
MLKLTLNGQKVALDVDPNMPLLYALRDIQQLTGTKFGCGAGLCGACTVHLDGESIRSCITPISVVEGKAVTTIEGLGVASDELHPVQQAWLENSVPQCGYCQAGQMMSAAALLAKNTNPSDEEINNHMQGNICRCGTYPRIKKAIKQAGVMIQDVNQAKPATGKKGVQA